MRVQNAVSTLMIASQVGHFEVVKFLCEKGGDRLLKYVGNVSHVFIPVAMQVMHSFLDE
jgi:hypothetical protein